MTLWGEGGLFGDLVPRGVAPGRRQLTLAHTNEGGGDDTMRRR